MAKSLDYWRGYFRGTNSDIFDIIEHAVMVAAIDCPKEFKLRRDHVAELLFTCKVTKCVGCDRVELAVPRNSNGDGEEVDDKCKNGGFVKAGRGKESKANSSGGDDDDHQVEMDMDVNVNQVSNYSYGEAEALTDEIEKQSQMIAEVLRIKEILDHHQDEDSFELDDDEPSNEPAPRSAEERGLEKSMMDSKSIPVEGQAFGRSPVSCEVRTQSVPVLSKRTKLDTSSASMNGEEHTAPTFSLSHASTRNSQSALPSQSALAPDSPTTAGDSPLSLGFGFKAIGNVPSSTERKAESSSSHSSEMVSSTGTTIISTAGSTTSTSAASDSGLFVAEVAPSISKAPVLNLGSSKDPSNAISAASTTANAETTGLKVNAEKENGLGKLSNSSLGSTTVAAGSTSSSIFGLGSFVSSSAANNQLQGSDTASGSGASTASSSAGSGIATVSPTVPVQFGSSSSSMVFSASGVPSTGFSFGASSSSFGTTNLLQWSLDQLPGLHQVLFSCSLSSRTQTAFSNTNPFAASPGNNDQMNTEDSMVEDHVQSSTPAAPVFGQAAVSPPPPPFQLGGQQQNQAAPQNPLQFQQSGSLEFNAGGSFSLGGSAGDKSGRKFLMASRNRNKKR